MNRQKPLTPELEDLVEELASNIQNYPETDEDTIVQTARELDNQTPRGQKQQCKDSLMQSLGYDTRGYKVRGSLQTISEDIIYLTDLGIEDIRKVVTILPQVLGLNIENIDIRVEYLKSIGVKDIRKVVTRHPQVLELDIEKMQLKVDYLKSIGVKEEDIGKVVTRMPQVLGLNIENMDTKVEYLKSIGVKKQDIGKIVTRLPALLVYSVEENLKPTYEFLQSKFKVCVGDIVKTPGLFGYSLKKRIKPRYEFLKSKGLKDKYKASTVLVRSDKRFCSLLKCSLEEYQAFKEDYIERNKK